MNMHDHSVDRTSPSSLDSQDSHRVTPRRSKWIAGGVAAVLLLMLAVEHREHLLGWLPWIVLLACPLMHVFMHRGHGGHGGDGGHAKPGNGK